MSDFLIAIKDNALAISTLVGVFTIIGAGLGFWVNFRLSRRKLESDKKSLRQQMITNNIAPMRQKWISEIRNEFIFFMHSTELLQYFLSNTGQESLKKTHTEKEAEDIRLKAISDVRKSYYTLDLLLPIPNKKRNEDLSNLIRDGISAVANKFRDDGLNEEINFDELEKEINKISSHMKKLLKQEWEVTKSLKEIE